MTHHTPTPWDINAYNLTQIIKVNPGPDHEGKTYVDGRHQVAIASTMGAGHLTWGERHANAEFIVRACNAHADLVSLAEEALEREYNPFEPDNQSAKYYQIRSLLAKAKVTA